MSEVRLIDANAYAAEMKVRQDACKELMDAAKQYENWEVYDRMNTAFGIFVEAKLTLDNMPTVDVVPVVRCSECVHFAEWTAYEKTQFGVTRDGGCKYWNWISTNKNGFCYQGVRITDGYCADGERKDGADDGRTD